MQHVRVLQDGFWERTTVVRDQAGQLFVCKETTSAGIDSPWGQNALRAEIQFLKSVSPEAAPYYPPLIDDWEDTDTGTIGYRIPFFSDYPTVAEAVLQGTLTQVESDTIQSNLAKAVFAATHRPVPHVDFVTHVSDTIDDAVARLCELHQFTDCIEASDITINDKSMPGLRQCFAMLKVSPAMKELESLPTVRLHGDLILENVLWNADGSPPLRLIDPVSVAGITHGPAAFDLVKYASYATGELYALRSGNVPAGPVIAEPQTFRYAPPRLPAFSRVDLLSVFASAFEDYHGERNPRVERLLDGYFSLVMAVNTSGVQQWGRILKGILELNAATETLET
ncbi:MAG: hypothetical protein ACI9R3_002883 [Verrucomicrobiales bacterium]